MRKYTVGINVHSAAELAAIAPQLRSFLDVVGDGDLDVQLSVNPLLTEEITANAIGFAVDAPTDAYYDEEDDDE